MQFARVNGITIHYQVFGAADKPLIVFINSLGTDFRIWRELSLLLAGDFAMLCYDKRGHGLSEIGRTPHSIENHADDLIALMEQLDLGPGLICGLSIGGMIAQTLWSGRPDLVSGLILCDTAQRIATADFWNARIAAVGRDGLESVADAVMTRWFATDFLRTAECEGYRAMLARQPAAGYIASCEAIRDADLSEIARRIDVPALVVVGENDGATPPELCADFARLIPRARFEIVKRAGHLMPVEQPLVLSQIIREFAAPSPATERWRVTRHDADRRSQGMATRREVLGDRHVDSMEAGKNGFDGPFQELITEAAWGHVWSRPHWSKRERSIVTIALLAALGHDEEVAMHVRATARTGATEDDVREALLHVAIYAGVPVANQAIKIAKQAFAEVRAGRMD